MVTAPMHLWCTLKTQRFPMVFNDFHVVHLVRNPRAACARRGPLRRCVAVGRDHTVKMFIFTRFYKGFKRIVRF